MVAGTLLKGKLRAVSDAAQDAPRIEKVLAEAFGGVPLSKLNELAKT